LDQAERTGRFGMAVALIEHQAGSFALELRGKGTALLGHRTPLCGEHSRLNGCPGLVDHYTHPKERFKQVFILTHNLFFFHEMLKNLKRGDDFSLFRITKAEYTAVIPMKASDVQNDYQSFWQTIRAAQEGRTSASVIPNMMRNILEYYFNFVHRQEALAEALQALADEDTAFRALYRYVNRESHSDAINLTDFGEIEPAHYIERFRQVFVRTGFEEHYLKMMG
ncbi:AAA domain-containing protein, partial [Pseudomonas sp. LAMO17WK12:I3]